MGHRTKALAQYVRAASREVHTLKFAAEVPRDTSDPEDREAWETLRAIERANLLSSELTQAAFAASPPGSSSERPVPLSLFHP
jgi:hypothetical protein